MTERPQHGTEMLEAGRAARRAMLGDEYVDAQTAETDPTRSCDAHFTRILPFVAGGTG